MRIDWGDEWWRDAVALLHALFRRGEWVHCGKEGEGHAVRERDEWCARWEQGEEIPPQVCVNPLRGKGRRCAENIAAFRHAVAKVDVPPDAQARFWTGWGLDAVAAVTHSGDGTLDVVLRVDAANALEWERKVRQELFAKWLFPLGCPVSCSLPFSLARLAGAVRTDRGDPREAQQRLVFVRGDLDGGDDTRNELERMVVK